MTDWRQLLAWKSRREGPVGPLAIGETEERLPSPKADRVMHSGTFGLGDPVQATSHWRPEREEVWKFLDNDYYNVEPWPFLGLCLWMPQMIRAPRRYRRR